MSSTLQISTGPLTRSKTYANDTRVQAVLDLCADRLGAIGTPARRLDAVLSDVETYLIECARQQHRAVTYLAGDAESKLLGME